MGKQRSNICFFLSGLFVLGICMILYILNCKYIFTETFIAVGVVMCGAFFVYEKGITYYIWTGWYLFLSVFQYGECYVHAENYAKKNTYMYYFLNLSILRDDSIRKLFFFYTTVFYIVIIAAICVIAKTDAIGRSYGLNRERQQKYIIYMNPAWWMGLVLVLQYAYLKFSGKGIIPINGMLHYAFEAVVFYLSIMLLKQLLQKGHSDLRTMLEVVMVAVIKSLPRLLSGSKSATIFAVLIFGITVYMYDPQRFRRIFNIKLLFLAGIAVFLAFEISYYMKFGYWLTSPDYIVRRFTGYNDGMAFLNYYMRYGNQYFGGGIGHWLDSVLGIGSNVNVNYFYTHAILGYLPSAVTSAGIPAFCGGLLYGNSIGLIIIAGIVAAVMTFLENGMRNDTQLEYIAVRVLVYVNMAHMLIDGGIDNLKSITMAAIGYLLLIFIARRLHISFVLGEERKAYDNLYERHT